MEQTGRRWTVTRKTKIIEDMLAGLVTAAQACAQYDLSIEEIEEWHAAYNEHGKYGLRVTRLQCYHPERLRKPNGKMVAPA